MEFLLARPSERAFGLLWLFWLYSFQKNLKPLNPVPETAPNGRAETPAELNPLQGEIVDFMVRLFRLMGLPKTVGSIYGYVYASPEPVCMDDVTRALGISLGSASQGLRTLKVFRAIRPVVAQSERRDYYEAETNFQQFVGAFLRGELEQYIENTSRRAGRMREQLTALEGDPHQSFYRDRIERLAGMNARAKAILPLLDEVFAPSQT